jgi:Flp pilus assembly protein CpaB
VLAANEGKLQLVMRNYSDREDTQTTGASKNSLLTGDSFIAEPPPPSAHEQQKAAQTVKRPIVTRISVRRQEKLAAEPISRNSVELIEGAKRREVELP